MKKTKIFKRGLDWGLYDFANSGYYMVYVVLIFPLYLTTVVMKGDKWLETKWGIAQGVSVVLAVLLGIIFGRILDRRNINKVVKYIAPAPALLSFLFPILIFFRASGIYLLVCYLIVQSVYLLSLTVYDSTLAHVAEGEESLNVSGWAWGWGYMGGLFCIILMQIGLKFWERFSVFDFMVGSSFFLIFAVLAAKRFPRLLKKNALKENSDLAQNKTPDAHFKIKLKRWQLLLIFILIVDGIAIFFAFFSMYCSKVALLPETEITRMIAVLQLLAFPLTGLITSMIAKRLPVLLWFCGITWVSAGLLVILMPTRLILWTSVIIVSSTVGTTQSALRAIYSNTVTESNAIQGFSLYAIVEKGAAFIGPTIAGFLIFAVGHSFVIGMAGFMVFLGCGYLSLVFRLQEKRAME